MAMPKPAPRKKRDESSHLHHNPYLVFVSHATADKWIATVLCEKMEETGAKTFRDDRDIGGGDDIRKRSGARSRLPMNLSYC